MVGGYCGARRGNAVSHAMRGKRDHVQIAFNHPHFVGAFYGTGFRNPIKFAAFLEQQGFGRVKVFGMRTLIQRAPTKSDDAGGEKRDVKCFVRRTKGNFGAPSGDKKPTFEVLDIIICAVSLCGAAKTPCQQQTALRASVLLLLPWRVKRTQVSLAAGRTHRQFFRLPQSRRDVSIGTGL